eukprot:gene24550-biopygen23905
MWGGGYFITSQPPHLPGLCQARLAFSNFSEGFELFDLDTDRAPNDQNERRESPKPQTFMWFWGCCDSLTHSPTEDRTGQRATTSRGGKASPGTPAPASGIVAAALCGRLAGKLGGGGGVTAPPRVKRFPDGKVRFGNVWYGVMATCMITTPLFSPIFFLARYFLARAKKNASSVPQVADLWVPSEEVGCTLSGRTFALTSALRIQRRRAGHTGIFAGCVRPQREWGVAFLGISGGGVLPLGGV